MILSCWITRPWINKICCYAILALLAPQIAFADYIVMKNGQEIRGSIANKEQIAHSPLEFQIISILTDDEHEMKRIFVEDIQYLVLEDGGEKRVIEFGGIKIRNTKRETMGMEIKSSSNYRDQGLALMIFGGSVAAFGALYKFGDEKAVVTATSIDYDEKSYNALNYAMMVGGGILFLIGIVLFEDNESQGRVMDAAYFNSDQETARLGIQLPF